MCSRFREEPMGRGDSPSKMHPAVTLRRQALCVVLGLMLISLVTIGIGTYTSSATESLKTTGGFSGFIFVFATVLSVLGLTMVGNRQQLLTAAIFFLSLGIVATIISLVLDGFLILPSIDVRPITVGRCQFYSGGQGFIYENHYASVPCQGLSESCLMTVRSGTCYCCDLYDCANGGFLARTYEFVGVQGCKEVLTVYYLLWGVAGLNILALLLGLLSSALLGNIKALDDYAFQTHNDAMQGAGWDLGKSAGSAMWDNSVVHHATAPPLPMDMNDIWTTSVTGQGIYQSNGHTPQTLDQVSQVGTSF